MSRRREGEWRPEAMALPVGLGCAPIYLGIIHATPSHFGADRSQAIIGVQMASAYVGNCLMPLLYPLSMMVLDVVLPCGKRPARGDVLIKYVSGKKNEEDCMKDDKSIIFS